MTKVSKQEVLNIARMSQVYLQEDEVDAIVTQLEQVLTYAERVQEGALGIQKDIRMKNVLRDDVVVSCDSSTILSQAPEKEGDYFVVPKIIENN